MSTTPTRSQTPNRIVFLLEWATSNALALPVPWDGARTLAPFALRRVERLSGSGSRRLKRLLATQLTFVMLGGVAQ